MSTQAKATKKVIIKVGDMACTGCANTVKEALENIHGVEKASVSHEKGEAEVLYASDTVSKSDFKQAIDKAGYTFKDVK